MLAATMFVLGALCDGVVWAVVLGALALVTAIEGFGFTYSRQLGCVTCSTADAVVLLLFCGFQWLAAALS